MFLGTTVLDPSGPRDVQEMSLSLASVSVSSAEHLLAEGATLSLAALVVVCSPPASGGSLVSSHSPNPHQLD